MMAFIVLLNTIFYCLLYLIFYVTKTFGIFPRIKRRTKEKLVGRHGFYVRLLIESSLELIICILVEIFMKQTNTRFEIFSYFVSVSMFIIFVATVKIINEVLNNMNLYKMNNYEEFPIFNLRYSALWEDLKTNAVTPKFQLYFVIRRLLIASIIVIPP